MPGAIAISDMAAIAAQISSTRSPGTRALAPLVAASGRARRATTTRMRAIAVDGKEGPAPVAVAGEQAADERTDQDRHAPGA